MGAPGFGVGVGHTSAGIILVLFILLIIVSRVWVL